MVRIGFLLSLAAHGLLVCGTTAPAAPSQSDGDVAFDLHFDQDADVDVDIHIHVDHGQAQVQMNEQPLDDGFSLDGSNADQTGSSAGSAGTSDSGEAHNAAGSPPPTKYLYPAIHPDIDTSDPENLKASLSAVLYYEDGADQSADSVTFGVVEITGFKYPTVVLEHTAHITSIICDHESELITIVFSDSVPFETAARDWKAYVDGFHLITYFDGCGSGTLAGERTFLLVTSFIETADTLTMKLTSTIVTFPEALHPEQEVTVAIGSYAPTTNGSGGSSDRSSGPDVMEGISQADGNCATTKDFDIGLDCQIGYMDPENYNYEQLLPGAHYPQSNDEKPHKKRQDSPRNSNAKNFGTKQNEAKIKKESGGTKAAAVGPKQALALENKLRPHMGDIDDVPDEDSLSYLKTFDLTLRPSSNTVKTDYGEANTLFSAKSSKGDFAVYCVRCGTEGSLKLDAKIKYTLLKGIQEAYVEAKGNVNAGMGLFMDGKFQRKFTTPKLQLSDPGLSQISIPYIFAIGPKLSFDLGGTFDVAFNGKLYAGYRLEWGDFSAKLDFKNPKSSKATGWEPKSTPTFSVIGEVALAAELFSDIMLEFEVAILPAFSFGTTISASLTDRPSIILNGATSAQATIKPAKNSLTAKFSDPKCTGIQTSTKITNVLTFGAPCKTTQLSSTELKEKMCYPLSKKSRRESSRSVALDSAFSSELSNSSDSASNAFSSDDRELHDRKRGDIEAESGNERNDTNEGTFWQITSTDFSLNVFWAANGNMIVLSADDDVAAFGIIDDQSDFYDVGDGTIGAGSDYRLLHAYIDTLDTLGVSRMRLATDETIPLTSVLVALETFEPDGDSESDLPVVLASTTAGDFFYPITCVFKDENVFAKIFLAKDPDQGVKTLMREDLRSTLTGGEVDVCGYVKLTASG